MATYSFMSVQATISGPNGSISIGHGAGAAEEGITTAMAEDKNTQTPGADGQVMNSLHAANNGVVTFRLLKTSPVNAKLMAMYNADRQGPSTWGQNIVTVSDIYRGDVVTARACAFKKAPDLTYAKDGGMVEWAFDAGYINELLGAGSPDVNT